MAAMFTRDYLQEIGLLHSNKSSFTPAEASGSSALARGLPRALAPLKECSPEELAKMSKEERRAYHLARRTAEQAGTATSSLQRDAGMTKAQRRAIQEAQRKAKEDKVHSAGDQEEFVKELMLQGLSEEQAKEVMAEMAKVEDLEDEDDDDEPEDLLASVRKWMEEQATVTKEALHDFNMKVRFQGHVETTPPDHLKAILRVITEQACAVCDLAAPKLQPTIVAQKAEPLVAKWAPLLEPLYGKIDDVLAAGDAVVQAVQEGVATRDGMPESGQACAVVGCLMAIREIDMIEDEDLLTGCRRLESRSLVMDKFVEFLEDEMEGEDDDEDGD